MLAMHPTMARQLADRGFTKESFLQYLYDSNVIDYDSMTEEQREALKEQLSLEAKLGRTDLRPEDVKPGLHREPFSDPENVLLMIAGSGSGQTHLYHTSAGSTAGVFGETTPMPWMIKVVHGAALTKYGK